MFQAFWQLECLSAYCVPEGDMTGGNNRKRAMFNLCTEIACLLEEA
jgi:hypothetical protein